MSAKLRQRIGDLIRERGLTYSKFARASGVSMPTARKLYEDPYYNLTGSTLLRSAEFFGVEPGELVIEESQERSLDLPALGTPIETPADSELIDKLLALVFPESLLSQARSYAGKDLVGFVQQAIAEKVEREDSNLLHKSSGIERKG